MKDLEYMANKALARAVLMNNTPVWAKHLPDRVVYLFYESTGALNSFWLRPDDALNEHFMEDEK